MRILKDFALQITKFNEKVGRYLKFVVLFLLALLLVGIFCRYCLNAPILWETEILAYAFNGLFFLAGGYALHAGAFARMDAFYSKWNVKTRALADAGTFILVAVYLIPLILKGSYYTYVSLLADERWNSAAATPVYPYKFIIVVGCILLLLQVIAFFISDLHTVMKGSPIIEEGKEEGN